MVDEGDAGAEGLRLLHVVRREDDGRTAAAQRADQFPEPGPGVRVHSVGRLVHDEYVRFAEQGPRQVDPLHHAPGERLDAVVAAAVQPQELQDLLGAPAGGPRVETL